MRLYRFQLGLAVHYVILIADAPPRRVGIVVSSVVGPGCPPLASSVPHSVEDNMLVSSAFQFRQRYPKL